MRLDVITIFPEYLAPLRAALLGKAIERGLLSLEVHDLRNWTHDVHRAVDDSPYGGGPGMVMKPQVWGEALDAVCTGTPRLVVPSPAGRPFTQALAHSYAAEDWLVFACGLWTSGDLAAFLGLPTSKPANPFGAFSVGLDTGVTGFYVYVADLGTMPCSSLNFCCSSVYRLESRSLLPASA